MPISDKTKQIWIEKGYEHFALYGPENFSINKISKTIGLSRASFYHHFGDIDIFVDELLAKHWQITETGFVRFMWAKPNTFTIRSSIVSSSQYSRIQFLVYQILRGHCKKFRLGALWKSFWINTNQNRSLLPLVDIGWGLVFQNRYKWSYFCKSPETCGRNLAKPIFIRQFALYTHLNKTV